MWLLDANLPVQLVVLLTGLGIRTDSAITRGWNTLSNGRLVETAVRAEFTVLLTRDRLFAESAARVLGRFPEFSVVRVTLPEARAPQFLAAFESAWRRGVIEPLPGRVVEWPV
jgi:predicted nuclease of predicted toxin-antitoxin system